MAMGVATLPSAMPRRRADAVPTGPTRVRIVDLAEATGLSPMTVHRALTGSPLVAKPSRDLVLEAAKRLGYRLNASARAMRTGRFQSVALIIGHLTYSSNVPSALTQALAQELNARNYRMQVAAIAERDLDDPERLPQVLSELSVDGLLVKFDHHLPPRMQDLIDRSGLPVMYLNSKRGNDCIHPDDSGAAQAVTNAVIAAGAKRLAYASCSFDLSDSREHYSAFDRLAGFKAACGTRPHAMVADRLAVTARVPTIMAAVQQLAWPWSGIGYSSDEVILLREAARRLGHPIDEVPWGAVSGSSLVTAAVGPRGCWGDPPEAEVGRIAVTQLLARIAQPTAPQAAIAVPFPLHRC